MRWGRTALLLLLVSACGALWACGGRSGAGSAPPRPSGAPGEVELVMTGFRNDVGRARFVLFLSADGFPKDDRKAARNADAAISGGKATVTLRGIPAGEFAVAMLHDENGDAAMEKNFLGVPQEGFGFSRNPEIGLSAPAFSECKVELLPGGNVRVEIHIIYM